MCKEVFTLFVIQSYRICTKIFLFYLYLKISNLREYSSPILDFASLTPRFLAQYNKHICIRKRIFVQKKFFFQELKKDINIYGKLNLKLNFIIFLSGIRQNGNIRQKIRPFTTNCGIHWNPQSCNFLSVFSFSHLSFSFHSFKKHKMSVCFHILCHFQLFSVGLLFFLFLSTSFLFVYTFLNLDFLSSFPISTFFL